MKDLKHTKENWKYKEGKYLVVSEQEDSMKEKVICQTFGSREESEANAKLIASALMLLDVAKYAYAMLHQDRDSQFFPLVEQLRKVIKQATEEPKTLLDIISTENEPNIINDIIDGAKKQKETLEEFIEREGYLKGITQEIWEDGVRLGAKWQQERMYSEEEMKNIVEQTIEKFYKHRYSDKTKEEMKELWFEQFKKK
jgi:hypothetical protein